LRDLVFNLTAEHKNLEDELARLSRARNIDTIEWASRFEDFTHLLERHFRRKESELFPRAEALLNSRELSWALHEFISEKGDEIRERRRNLGIGAKTIWSGAAALAVLGLVLAARRSRFARRP
jgi:hemerythrin-like domain-containing protein